MTAISEAVERIVQVLSEEDHQPARKVLRHLTSIGMSAETVSRAIGSGASAGQFTLDNHLRLSLGPHAAR